MLGSIISGIGSIIGGIMGKDSQDEANQIARENAERNIALQREFAQNSIRWKVDDAKAAGIHPLYALGASGSSFSPVSLTQSSGNPLGEAAKEFGQDLSRAVNATRSTSEKADAFTTTVQALTVQKMGLENELLSSQIRKINQAGPTPGMPINQRYLIPGQGSTAGGALIDDNPMKRTYSAPGAPSQEPGALPGVGYERTPTGWAPVPSSDVKERIEDNIIQETMWAVRNNLWPSLQSSMNPPSDIHLKPGQSWFFNPMSQEYQIVDQRDLSASQAKFNRYMDYISGYRSPASRVYFGHQPFGRR